MAVNIYRWQQMSEGAQIVRIPVLRPLADMRMVLADTPISLTVDFEHRVIPFLDYSDGWTTWRMAVDNETKTLFFSGSCQVRQSNVIEAAAQLPRWRLYRTILPHEWDDVLLYTTRAVCFREDDTPPPVFQVQTSVSGEIHRQQRQARIYEWDDHVLRLRQACEHEALLCRLNLPAWLARCVAPHESPFQEPSGNAYRLLNTYRFRYSEQQPEDYRKAKFEQLRKKGKTLGEINTLLEKEGFTEITQAEGMTFLPTKQHKLCWDSPKKFTTKYKGPLNEH